MDLTSLSLALVAALILFGVTTYLAWGRVKVSWLNQVARAMIITLPFERIPSLDIPIGTLKINQILVLVGFYIIFILLIKRDPKLLKLKLNKYNLFWLFFVLFSIPSWYFAEDFGRFFSTFIITLISIGAFFLVSNFTKNPLERLRELTVVFIWVSFFGLYQFFGDLIGLPLMLTGLSEAYTKDIFGIPRIMATAIEPQYYAGMLIIPILTTFFFLFSNKHILKRPFRYSNFLILILFLVNFALTLSKGAFLVLAITSPVIVYISVKNYKAVKYISRLPWFGFLTLFFLAMSLLYSQNLLIIGQGIWRNVVATFQGVSASSSERLLFIRTAWFYILQKPIFGYGSGQFGILAQTPLAFFSNEGHLIVNNVYLEIWLEFGLLSLLTFCGLLFFLFLNKSKEFFGKQNIFLTVVFLSSAAYIIQWLFYSPIYIMPIMICLGLFALPLNHKSNAS